jgi:peptidoglycan/xylan/chitin deacetylase (PgdA/CDA1 family)
MFKRQFKHRILRIACSLILIVLLELGLPTHVSAANPSILVSQVTTPTKLIALTFDFGSDVGNLPTILQILTEHQVKSTFFATGEAASQYPDAIRAVLAQGSELGNHSWSHPNFTLITDTQMNEELLKTQTIIQEITNQSPKPYFRPPYGALNAAVLQAAGNAGYSQTITWSIDTLDWQDVSATEIQDKVISQAAPGAIVLMHVGSGAAHIPEALPVLIKGLREKNYQIVTITQLLSQMKYIVQPGDTLYQIATLFKVTVQNLVAANNIVNPNLIYPGQVLYIPLSGQQATIPLPSTPTSTPTSTPPPLTSSNPVRYIVKPGDTLYRISRLYGISVIRIISANLIVNPNLIYPGQNLVIPR